MTLIKELKRTRSKTQAIMMVDWLQGQAGDPAESGKMYTFETRY
jgi:hypothetical protein